ncbi:MAG: signal peptidase I [Clostridia bacterium]|nr:signal peptidase I [Clostridia bacterium]
MSEAEFENDLNDILEQPAEAETKDTAETAEKTAAKADKEKDSEPNTIVGAMYEGVSIIVSSIMIIALVFTFAFRLIGVNGTSMNDTLSDGDWLLVTPYYSEPQYGDIVISTKDTAAEGPIVKRVIAVAGDEVIVDEHDNVTVNGVALQEDSYTIKDGGRHGNLTYPITVPEGCVMLMGDNRCGSWDSRFMEIGFAEDDYLLGKARLRLSKDYNIYANFHN